MKMHLDSGHFLQSQARILAAWRFRRFAPKTDWKLIPGIMLAACTMCKQLTWWIRENPWDDRLTGHLADTELRAINLDGAGRCREQVSGNGSPILPGSGVYPGRTWYTQGGLGFHSWPHRPRHQKELLSFGLLAARLHRQGDWMQKSSPNQSEVASIVLGRGRPHQQHTQNILLFFFVWATDEGKKRKNWSYKSNEPVF